MQFEVDVNDLLALLGHFGSSRAAPSGSSAAASFHAAMQASDINGDGAVGVDDLLTLLSDFGSTC